MESSGTRTVGGGRALAGAALVVLAVFSVQPSHASERLVGGGYGLDSSMAVDPGLQASGHGGLALAGGTHSAGGVALGLDDQGAFLSYFTPRFGGFRVGLGRGGLPTPGGASDGLPQLGLGVSYLQRFGGFEIGLAGGGALELAPSTRATQGAETRASLVVGGLLRMPDLGYGPMSARLTYGIESQPARAPVSELALGADLLLWPGVAVTGEVARAEEQDGPVGATTRGHFGLRLRF